MAHQVKVILVDDTDGGPAEETVAFGLDGAEYEIDLSAKNAKNFRDSLAPWKERARKTGGRRRSTRSSSGSSSDIRAWALANGHQVSSRGRVSAEVREAYEKANA
jgi:Lsr2